MACAPVRKAACAREWFPSPLVQEGFGLAIIHSAQDQHAILDGLKRLQNVRELEPTAGGRQ
jgi:hypothetical protein